MRIDDVEKSEAIKFRWRPYSCRVVMTEQNNIPFTGKAVKKAYMWRDIERRGKALIAISVDLGLGWGRA